MKKIGIGFAAGMVTLLVMGALVRYTGSFTGLDAGLTNSVGVHPWHPGEVADGSQLINLYGVNILNGTVNSNALDSSTRALLGGTGFNPNNPTNYNGAFTGNGSGLTNITTTATNFPTTLNSLTVTNLFVQPTNAPGSTWVAAFNTNNGDLVLPAGTAGINAHLLIESNLIVMGGIISSNVTTNATGTTIKGQFPITINGSTFYIDLKQ